MVTVHSHTLDDLAGYEVRQTMIDRRVVGTDGPIITRVDNPHRYTDAVRAAQELRYPGSWALVDNVYRCGCTSRSVSA